MENKEYKIALVCNSLVTLGGVERRTIDLASQLFSAGFVVELIILRENAFAPELWPLSEIPVIYFPVYIYTDRLVIKPVSLFKLWFFLRRRQYSVVVGLQAPAHYFLRITVFPPIGIRVIAMERLSLAGRSWKFRCLDKLLSLWTDKIICVGSLMRDQLVSISGISVNKIEVIHNGLTPPHNVIHNSAFSEALSGKFVFGFVGSLEERKRPWVLLNAFALLAEDHSDVALVLVGDGELQHNLRSYIMGKHLDGRVLLIGNSNAVHSLYPLFDAFVFPSILEGLPSVVVEAMFHSLPVVCANLRPMTDVVVDELNGLLSEPDSIESFLEKMRILYQDRSKCRYLGQNGRRLAEREFDRSTQMQKLISTIKGSY